MLESHDVQRATEGDAPAFDRIVRATFERSLRIANRICAREADARDVVQEAYTRAFVALREGRFHGEAPQLQAWLDRIVVRASLDALRARSRRERHLQPAHDPDTLAQRGDPDARVDAAKALAAVQALSPEQRAAFVLRELEGLSIHEAALALQCTDGAIEQRVLRAWAALRRRFAP